MVKLEADRRFVPVCSACQNKVRRFHSFEFRSLRDLPMSDAMVVIHFRYRNIWCPDCGIRLFSMLVFISRELNLSLKAISRKAKLRWASGVERIHNNIIKPRMYNCGVVPVEMPNDRSHRQLWLVGYFGVCASAKQAVALAIKGYGLRWKIEEVHRQIIVDYQ